MKMHTLNSREESRRLSLIRDAARRVKQHAAMAAWTDAEEEIIYSEPATLRILPDADEPADACEE